ncbi:MAG: DMT family transporter [Bacteroidetes bacterium]|nr:DMT family transporter [Bacteroidota bacterium]MBM3425164.1 DMT family transporter [Bacteroidota bacterium]
MAKGKAILLLHGIVFLWGFTGIIGKLLDQNPIILVWYRLLIASIGLLLYIAYRRESLRIPKTRWLPVIFTGLIVALHWITFYFSIQLSTASLGILCLATTTFHVVWLEPLLLKLPFNWSKLLLSVVVVLGVAFIARDFEGDVLIALLLGLLSALLAAIFSVSNAKLSRSVEPPVLSLFELATGWVGISLVLIWQDSPHFSFQLTWEALIWLLFLGLVCTSFAFMAAIYLVKKLGAYTVSLTINLEPVYTMLLAAVLLKEHEILSTEFYVGAALIITVLLVNARFNPIRSDV